jgi:hypothetical protein
MVRRRLRALKRFIDTIYDWAQTILVYVVFATMAGLVLAGFALWGLEAVWA